MSWLCKGVILFLIGGLACGREKHPWEKQPPAAANRSPIPSPQRAHSLAFAQVELDGEGFYAFYSKQLELCQWKHANSTLSFVVEFAGLGQSIKLRLSFSPDGNPLSQTDIKVFQLSSKGNSGSENFFDLSVTEGKTIRSYSFPKTGSCKIRVSHDGDSLDASFFCHGRDRPHGKFFCARGKN